ncbi:MAG: DUF2298 domain-containing protein [Acidobacteriota bacterium]
MKRRPYVPAAALLATVLARASSGLSGTAGWGLIPAFGELFSSLAWCLTVVALGWFTFPLFRRMFGEWPDQGWFLARWAGLFFVSWGGWALAATRVVAFWPWGVLIAFAVLSSLAWVLSLDGSGSETGLSALNRTWIAGGELLFWGVFGLLLLARCLNPDLLSASTGGEKPMELGILNAVVRTSHFPPADPWLSGYALNYYYFGYVPFALLIRLTGVPVSIGFNLAVPTIGAFAAVGALLVVGALTSTANEDEPETRPKVQQRSFVRALWGPVLLLGVGNLYEPRLIVSGFRRLGETVGGVTVPLIGPFWQTAQGFFAWLIRGAAWPYSQSSLYWSATRVISHPASEAAPVSEFPLFSVLFADLHPHLIALPALLFLLLTLVGGKGRDQGRSDRSYGPSRMLVTGAVLGTVVLINPWELPLAVLLTVGAVFVLPRLEWTRRNWMEAGLSLLVAVVVLTPHLLVYESPIGGVRLWEGSRTSLAAFLWIHGLFVLTMAWWLWSRLSDGDRRSGRRQLPRYIGVWTGLLVLIMVTLLEQMGLISGAVWMVSLLTAALLVLFVRTPSIDERRITGLLVVGCLLSLIPEFFALNGDIGRMNLVFKLYFEIWCLWSVSCAAGLVRLSSDTGADAARRIGNGWQVGLAVVLAAALLYPVLAFRARALDRTEGASGFGLDGLAALADVRYPWQGKTLRMKTDLAAIHWLQKKVSGAPTLAEAVTDDYGPGGRVSSATGLPTILGWPGHEIQQHQARDFRAEVRRRRADVRRLYSSTRSQDILPVLERYDVDFIMVGDLERAVYGEKGLAKFEADAGVFWDRVFTQGDTVLYRVRSSRQ